MYCSRRSRCSWSTSFMKMTALSFPRCLKSCLKYGEQILNTSLWALKNFVPAVRVTSVYSSLSHSSSAPAQNRLWWSFHANKKSSDIFWWKVSVLCWWILTVSWSDARQVAGMDNYWALIGWNSWWYYCRSDWIAQILSASAVKAWEWALLNTLTRTAVTVLGCKDRTSFSWIMHP